MTLNDTWAYNREDRNWKSDALVLRALVDSVATGGNLLLNVGPNGRGELNGPTRAILESVGEWMHLHGRAITGCGPSAFKAPDGCRYTQRGDRLYVHLLTWPRKYLLLEGLGSGCGMPSSSTTRPRFDVPSGFTSCSNRRSGRPTPWCSTFRHNRPGPSP